MTPSNRVQIVVSRNTVACMVQRQEVILPLSNKNVQPNVRVFFFNLFFFFLKAKHELTFSSGTMAYRSDGETQTLAEKQDYMM